ncbi:MAG: hypothetical protein DBX90_08200 [Lentisphaerae bacterium]|nr:MAG: hypothetical protein DBX90_08200 [Lentisphaerota bacterium]
MRCTSSSTITVISARRSTKPSRNKKLVKLLQWEDGGFVIWMKRLECGGFHIPQSADGRIELTGRELSAILSGIKPQRYYKRYSKIAN